MAHEEKMEEIDNVDVEALNEADLEEVAGGAAALCSGTNCSNSHN